MSTMRFLKAGVGVASPGTLCLVAAVAALAAATPASAGTIFTDGTFNLANYQTSAQFLAGTGTTLTAIQCASCGNPGTALQVTATFPKAPVPPPP